MIKRVLALLLSCAVAAGTMPATACTPQEALTVVTDIQRFLPAVTNVATASCAFVSNPLCSTGVATVTSSANIAITEIKAYLTAVQGGTATSAAWDYMNTALTQFEKDSEAIFALVHVVDAKHQSEILAMVGAAQTLLAVIETMVPSAPPGATKAMALAYSAHAPVGKFDLGQWTADYNAKVAAAQKVLPRDVSLKTVHVHSALARAVTMGRLQ